MAFTYLTVDQWLPWIRQSEAVDQSNDLPEEWSVNQPFIQGRLEASSNRINNALATGGWITPLPYPYPPAIVDCCGWLTWWGCELYGEIRASVQTHYEACEEWLEQLATGELVLTDANGVPIPNAKESSVEGRFIGGVVTGERIAINPWAEQNIRTFYPDSYYRRGQGRY